jgi:P27 family predicted phage terminase small subunit
MTEIQLAEAPQHFTTAERQAYEHIRSSVDWLSESDLHCVYDYCKLQGQIAELEEAIAEHGLMILGSQGQHVANPLLKDVAALRRLVIQLQDRLELNPRAKRLAKRVESTQDTSELEGFLSSLDE